VGRRGDLCLERRNVFATVVRMAFTTTQTIDTVLLRGLNFRTPANAAISSQYTLYANGAGQTYWSNSITPNSISTLSTSMGYQFSTVGGILQFQSTQISTLGGQIVSTGVSFTDITTNLGLYDQYLTFIIDQVYTSSIAYTNSTFQEISGVSSFFNEISTSQGILGEAISTLSTATGEQNTSTFDSLTVNYLAADDSLWVSTLALVADQISSISSVVAYESELSTFSTVITDQLLSTSEGLYEYASTINEESYSTLVSYFDGIVGETISTVISITPIVFNYVELSTNLSTITNEWISSFVSTSQADQDIYLFQAIGVNASSISCLQESTNNLMYSYSTFSTNYAADYASTLSTQAEFNTSLIALTYSFSVLTTSSILVGIYQSFIDLEIYTSTLLGSTIGATTDYQENLYFSTVIQNESISMAYFDFYVSTLYASTLSTLIPSTIAYTSSMVSTLYSTSYTFLTSSLASTIVVINEDYVSTISSYTFIYISTVGEAYNSSVLNYLSTPAGELISTFSTLDTIALSTFQSTSVGDLANQSTLFYSTFLLWQSTASGQMSTSYNYLYLQSSLLISSSTDYQSTLEGSLNSTNAAVYNYTTAVADQTLLNITNSTNTTYNIFVENLNASASTAALSTLYTASTLNLTDGQFVATMDFATYRNFNINIYNIVNGSSNYVLNYQSNVISALDYRSGLITLNVSTVGLAYNNNNKQLRFDVNRWGYPTGSNTNLLPYISSASYIAQYQYNILNSVVYTNLLNIYPRLAIQNLLIYPTTVRNVYVSSISGWSYGDYWRGSPIKIGWSNYTYYPYSQLGSIGINPDILIDVIADGYAPETYGPYPYSQSTATVYAPYLTQQSTPVISTVVNVYIAGLQAQKASVNFNTIIPGFDTINIVPVNYGVPFPANTRWIGGQELIAITENQNFPLYNLPITVTTTKPGPPTPLTYYNNNALYQPSNLLNGPINTASNLNVVIVQTPSTFVGPSGNILGADQLASARITPNLTSNALFTLQTIDAVSSIVYYNLNAALGNVPGTLNSNATAGMSISSIVRFNGNRYMSTFVTTNALIQTFSI